MTSELLDYVVGFSFEISNDKYIYTCEKINIKLKTCIF